MEKRPSSVHPRVISRRETPNPVAGFQNKQPVDGVQTLPLLHMLDKASNINVLINTGAEVSIAFPTK